MQGNESLREGLLLFDADWANIKDGQRWAAKHASENDEAALLCCEYPFAGWYSLKLRLRPRERITWLEPALVTARRLKNRRLEGWHLGGMGMASSSLGEYRRAIEYHEKHLEIAREIGDRQGEGVALGNLGMVYASLGEHRRAIEQVERWLQIARQVKDRRSEAVAL